MLKIGPKALNREKEEIPSVREASPNDPIYTRGFAIGEMRSRPSSKNTEEKTPQPQASPDSKSTLSLRRTK